MDNIGIVDAGIVALLGYAVVFFSCLIYNFFYNRGFLCRLI